jgi:hypothetical protein
MLPTRRLECMSEVPNNSFPVGSMSVASKANEQPLKPMKSCRPTTGIKLRSRNP